MINKKFLQSIMPPGMKVSDFEVTTQEFNQSANKNNPYSRTLQVFKEENIELLKDVDQNKINIYGHDPEKEYEAGDKLQIINFAGRVLVGYFKYGSGSGIELISTILFQEGIDFKFI